MHNDFLYCYSPSLFHFLRRKGRKYICIGVNERTGGRFWLFVKDDAVRRDLDEYAASK